MPSSDALFAPLSPTPPAQHEKGEISERAAAYLEGMMIRLHAKADAIESKGFEQHYDEEVEKMLTLFNVTEWKVWWRGAT